MYFKTSRVLTDMASLNLLFLSRKSMPDRGRDISKGGVVRLFFIERPLSSSAEGSNERDDGAVKSNLRTNKQI